MQVSGVVWGDRQIGEHLPGLAADGSNYHSAKTQAPDCQGFSRLKRQQKLES